MTVETAAARHGETSSPTLRERLAAVPCFHAGLAAVIVLQAVWLSVVVGSGWFYEADFANIASARGPLTLSLLTESQGGHLVIGDRFVYWLMFRVAPLNHTMVVVGVVIVSALTTLLLARLLVLLVGRRRGLLVLLALSVVTPMLVQTVVWTTASIAFLPGQLFGVLALTAHVRYQLTRRFVWTFATSAYLLLATLFSEQSAVIALMFPLLTVGYLVDGSWADRLRAVLRSWLHWIVVAAPIVVYVAYFFSSGKFAKEGQTGLTAGGATRVVWTELTQALGPGVFGGPITWQHAPGNYLQLTNPPWWAQVLWGAAIVLLVAWTVRRNGPRALIAWAMPLLVLLVGIIVVAVGRYTVLGSIIARQMEHTGYVVVPLVVGLALALWPDDPDAIRSRLTGAPESRPDETEPRPGRLRSIGVATVCVGIAACSVASTVTYVNHWRKAPAQRYVATLRASIDEAGPSLTLFDTYLSTRIVPALVDHRRMSDLLALMGEDVPLNSGSAPRIVDPRGRVVPAGFYTSASIDTDGPNKFCNNPVSGTAERVEPLSSGLRRNEWYLRIGLFQPHPNVIRVGVIDADGRRHEPVGGSRIVVRDSLAVFYVRFDEVAPRKVTVRGATADTNLCLTSATMGFPYVRKGP